MAAAMALGTGFLPPRRESWNVILTPGSSPEPELSHLGFLSPLPNTVFFFPLNIHPDSILPCHLFTLKFYILLLTLQVNAIWLLPTPLH